MRIQSCDVLESDPSELHKRVFGVCTHGANDVSLQKVKAIVMMDVLYLEIFAANVHYAFEKVFVCDLEMPFMLVKLLQFTRQFYQCDCVHTVYLW